jgi:HEPN domain-containing protein
LNCANNIFRYIRIFGNDFMNNPGYIPTRYPNGLPGGAPFQVYTAAQAVEAIAGARTILEFAAGGLARPPAQGG